MPSIDKIPKAHPHAERINRLVAEEKKKLEDLTELMGKRGLVRRYMAPEDLATQRTKDIHKDPIQLECSNDKESVSSDKTNQYVNPDTNSMKDVASSRKTDLVACHKPAEPCTSSVSTEIQFGGPKEQQKVQGVKAGNFVPLVGNVSPQLNSIIKMQTCSRCHKLSKVESNGTKIICKTCTDSSSTEEMLTVYRCGVCFMDFSEREVLARHMDEQHMVSPESVSSIITKTSTDKSNIDTAVTSLRQDPPTSADMGTLCPPVNLLLQNIVLQPPPEMQTLPVTFTHQNMLLNTAPMFTLQPSMLTTLSSSSAVITPNSFLSGPSMSLSTPAEVLIDPGKVLLPDPVPQVTKPKLNSMNKVMENNKMSLDGNLVEKTEIRKSNNQSPK